MLYRVIRESTVCLMGHERRLTLQMVDRLRQILSFNLFYGGCGESNGMQPFSQPYYHPHMVHYQPQVAPSRKQTQPMPVHQYRSRQAFDSASVSAGSSTGSSDVETPSTSGSEAVSTANSQSSSASSTHVPRQTLLYLPRNATRWIPVM